MLEEWSDNPTPDVTYTIGDDVITQADGTGIHHILYDGHGSTRHLIDQAYTVDGSGVPYVSDSYSYDGYGVMLQDTVATPGKTPQQNTNLLYAGEYFDTNAQHYNNRARWYNPYNGRFNRTDPYPGSPQDPQSLHKYLYCHNNPVNAIDPTGLFTFSLGEVLYVSTCVAYLAGMVTYEYTSSLKASLIVAAAAFVATFIALGGIGLTMAAITGGGAVASPSLLNPNSWEEAETMLGRVLRLPQNALTHFVDGMTKGRIPDFISPGRYIADSKWYQVPLNVSAQLRDFVTLARAWEIPLYIYVRVGTHVSQPAIQLIESTGGGVIRIFK